MTDRSVKELVDIVIRHTEREISKRVNRVVRLRVEYIEPEQAIAVAIDKVMKAVGVTFGVTPDQLSSKCRERPLTDARKMHSIVCKETIPNVSLKQIGRSIKHDHTTILFHLQTGAAFLKNDARFIAKHSEVLAVLETLN